MTYTIGEFAKKTNKTIKTLQNWDKTGKLKAKRSPSGRRFYTEDQLLLATGRNEYIKTDDDLGAVRGKVVLITGGTGSLGNALVSRIGNVVKKLIIYSRDELKQSQMHSKYQNDKIRYIIGDVRDLEKLKSSLQNVDICIHGAALKRIEVCSYCSEECVKTNIIGSMNVINACIYNGVGKALMVSTDKSCNPQTIYGSSKFTAEQLFINSNNSSDGKTILFCSRYGNVYSSRGSIRELFEKQLKEKGYIEITDEKMSRFFMSLNDAVDLNLFAINNSIGGEIFIPKLKAAKILDFARVFFPNAPTKIIGLRGYEKIYEQLISESEMRYTVDCEKYYKILPPYVSDKNVGWNGNFPKGKIIAPFKYTSDCVEKFTDEELIEFEKNYV